MVDLRKSQRPVPPDFASSPGDAHLLLGLVYRALAARDCRLWLALGPPSRRLPARGSPPSAEGDKDTLGSVTTHFKATVK